MTKKKAESVCADLPRFPPYTDKQLTAMHILIVGQRIEQMIREECGKITEMPAHD